MKTTDLRERFVATTTELLEEHPRTAVVLADISAASVQAAARRHPDRVLNVGIREQLMVGVAGGLALTGMRPIVHSYATFVIDNDSATHGWPGGIASRFTVNGWTASTVDGRDHDAIEAGITAHVPGRPHVAVATVERRLP